MDGRYALKITRAAREDIDNALNYISVNLVNSTAAVDLLDKIEKKTREIRRFPYSYPDCQYYYLDEKEYRHVVIGNYALFFYVREKEHRVEILRFLYMRMDFSKETLIAEKSDTDGKNILPDGQECLRQGYDVQAPARGHGA